MNDTPAQEPEHHAFTVSAEEAGQRLDKVISARLPDISRSRIQSLIAEGRVRVNGTAVSRPSYKVRADETVELELPPPKPLELEAQDIPLSVVYEDEHLIVIDKPAGLVVHPAPGHEGGTLVNALLHHVEKSGGRLSGIGGVERPGIVHRLDKDTSGLLVIAKTDEAHRHLSEQFAAHGRDGRLHRAYLALVWGAPRLKRGTVNAPIGRAKHDRTRMTVRHGDETAREAITHYEVLETYPPDAERPVASLLRCTLETGRTHQIRVHMAHIGHPVMGDPLYARTHAASARKLPPPARAALKALDRQALHAAELSFIHPVTGQRLNFKSPLPPDMQRLLKALRAV